MPPPPLRTACTAVVTPATTLASSASITSGMVGPISKASSFSGALVLLWVHHMTGEHNVVSKGCATACGRAGVRHHLGGTMHRFIAGLSLLGLLLFGPMSAIAAAPTPGDPAGREQDIRGVVHPRNEARRPGGTGNLLYHTGGSVQTGTHHTYAIYWGSASSFSQAYQSTINGFFSAVTADSGKTTNVYYSDTQYYQVSGTQTPVTYSEAFVGAWTDTTLPTVNGCSSTAGGPVCVSDTQLQDEITNAIAHNSSWSTGMGNEFFVFLGDGVSTCAGTSCAFSQFCAYHAHYALNGANVLYANMPYTGHNLSACGTQQYPNGDPAADSTINVTSHEANETVTDPLGNAWYDQQGNENGDKCAWNFGAAQGPTGARYNQVINGKTYFLQQEWSNHSTGCVQQGT